MQAILLATGETEKLRPLTEMTPSPMVTVANRPIMAYPLELLARQGFEEVLVSLHHLGGSVEAYFGSGRRWRVTLHYKLQREAWGTAGALKWAAPSLTETFVVMPADSLVDVDLAQAIAQHQSRRSAATVIVHAGCSHDQGAAEALCLDSQGRITALAEPGSDDPSWFNTAVYIFEPHVLDLIPSRTSFDIHRQLIPALLAAGLGVDACQTEGYWNRLDSFRDYQALQRAYLYSAWGKEPGNGPAKPGNGPAIRYPSIDGRPIAGGIWVGRNNIIHPAARLAPPVCIGNNCQIGWNVELGPEAIVGSNVIIDEEATVHQSTILDYSYVGQLVDVTNRLVQKNLMIDANTAESTEVVDRFLLDEVTPAILDVRLRRLMDFVLALFIFLLTLPVTLTLGLLVWLTSGGRLFSREERVGVRPGMRGRGQMGKPQHFSVLWFCTRHPDGRYTMIGRWLERWDLCRLPELWNVIKGDLGLVGVKPLTPEEAGRVTESWQKKRYDYHAGFTGLWYVQTNPNSGWDELLVTDAYYAATRNWREDFRLLFQAPLAWWRRKNYEG